MIKIFALDIDGVITDGTVTLDQKGNEYKTISFIDIDALSVLRRNKIKVALITGESGHLVDAIARKIKADILFKNAKNKEIKISELLLNYNISIEEISYIGDTKKDAEALKMLEHSFAPSNGDKYAKEAAKHILVNRGGNGAVYEAVDLLKRNKSVILKET